MIEGSGNRNILLLRETRYGRSLRSSDACTGSVVNQLLTNEGPSMYSIYVRPVSDEYFMRTSTARITNHVTMAIKLIKFTDNGLY